MNVKKLSLLVIVVALLSVTFAHKPFAGIGKPFPKPAPTSCPSDLLCW